MHNTKAVVTIGSSGMVIVKFDDVIGHAESQIVPQFRVKEFISSVVAFRIQQIEGTTLRHHWPGSHPKVKAQAINFTIQ